MTIDRRLVTFLAGGRFVSGQEMARRLGITRAAVNQHIERLRRLGVPVHSVRGRGYRLARPLEPLDAATIRAGLSDLAATRLVEIEVRDEVTSTNDLLREALAAGRRLDACFAEYQAAGRGRMGRQWLAAPFGSILFSMVHDLPAGPASSAGLSLAVGVAAARAVEACGCPAVALKWPNDLLIDGAKCGGILVEIAGEVNERCPCVIGVGINLVMPETLASQCAGAVTAVGDHVRGPVSRNALASSLASELVQMLEGFNRSGFAAARDEWQARDACNGRVVRVTRGARVLEGIARGVAEDGALQLQVAGCGVVRVTTGEVAA